MNRRKVLFGFNSVKISLFKEKYGGLEFEKEFYHIDYVSGKDNIL